MGCSERGEPRPSRIGQSDDMPPRIPYTFGQRRATRETIIQHGVTHKCTGRGRTDSTRPPCGRNKRTHLRWRAGCSVESTMYDKKASKRMTTRRLLRQRRDARGYIRTDETTDGFIRVVAREDRRAPSGCDPGAGVADHCRVEFDAASRSWMPTSAL